MASHKNKKERTTVNIAGESTDNPVTLKEMLGSDTVAKLKQHAEALKQEEANLREQKRLNAEAAKLAQQKLNEKDFEYLLNNSSMDWRKHKR